MVDDDTARGTHCMGGNKVEAPWAHCIGILVVRIIIIIIIKRCWCQEIVNVSLFQSKHEIKRT